jgi:hypothetical protein
MEESILTSTKKNLGIPEDYTAFDQDVLMHINSALATLNQIGVGPVEGFFIEDATPEWSLLLGDDPNRNMVQNWVYLKVRLAFDPPGTSFHIAAMQEQIRELEYRINTYREETEWVPPQPVLDPVGNVIDGGGA